MVATNPGDAQWHGRLYSLDETLNASVGILLGLLFTAFVCNRSGLGALESKRDPRTESVDSLWPSKNCYFLEAASLAHCQNFSAAGLSRPFAPTMPTEIGFGSGVMCKSFTRFPKV